MYEIQHPDNHKNARICQRGAAKKDFFNGREINTGGKGPVKLELGGGGKALNYGH